MQNHGVGFRWCCKPPRLACPFRRPPLDSAGLACGPAGLPVCQNPMRVIAAIGDPRIVEKTLRHLGVWHDPPPRPPPHGLPGFSRVGREGDFVDRTGNRK